MITRDAPRTGTIAPHRRGDCWGSRRARDWLDSAARLGDGSSVWTTSSIRDQRLMVGRRSSPLTSPALPARPAHRTARDQPIWTAKPGPSAPVRHCAIWRQPVSPARLRPPSPAKLTGCRQKALRRRKSSSCVGRDAREGDRRLAASRRHSRASNASFRRSRWSCQTPSAIITPPRASTRIVGRTGMRARTLMVAARPRSGPSRAAVAIFGARAASPLATRSDPTTSATVTGSHSRIVQPDRRIDGQLERDRERRRRSRRGSGSGTPPARRRR